MKTPEYFGTLRTEWSKELKSWRKTLTQAVAAGRLEVGIDTYRNWERGRSIPGKLAQEALRARMRRIKV